MFVTAATPTPSVAPKPSEIAEFPPPGGAPLKLKDYLPYMKNRTSRSGTPQGMTSCLLSHALRLSFTSRVNKTLLLYRVNQITVIMKLKKYNL